MPNCKKCGRQILFVKMESGRYMPCDIDLCLFIEGAGGAEYFVTPGGKLIRGKSPLRGETTDGAGYRPHWATCPYAEDFRRR